jgi:regulator of nucleoside diphosphate kinase
MIITEADFANLSLLGRQSPLFDRLQNAVIVRSDAVPPDIVTMQSRVLVADDTTGERRVVSLVFPGEADESSGRISVLVPLGMALLGASPGQAIEYPCAEGVHRFRLVEIVYQPEHDLRNHLIVRR